MTSWTCFLLERRQKQMEPHSGRLTMLFILQERYLLSMGTQSFPSALGLWVKCLFKVFKWDNIQCVWFNCFSPNRCRVHLLSLSVAETFINTQITAYYTYTQRRGHFILQLPSVQLQFLDCNTQAAQKSHNRSPLLGTGDIPSVLVFK